MFRGLATVNFWADDLLAAKQWHAEIFGIDAYSVVDPFGNILGIMTNPTTSQSWPQSNQPLDHRRSND